MNTDPSIPQLTFNESISVADPRSPSWGAVFAGAIAGLAVHFLLLMLMTALGLGAAQPATDDNPVATFAIGSAIAWSIAALIALWTAGWVAGRCAARVHSISGGMHGFLVWCLATLASLILIVGGAGALVGGAARIVGEGFSAIGKPAGGVANLAKETIERNASTITGMVDEVTQLPQVRQAGGSVAAARLEIGDAARQLFRDGGDLRDPEARGALLRAFTQAGVNEGDANRMIDRWIATMERVKTQTEQAKAAAAAKAREVADRAAKAMAQASLWSFVGFLIGAAAAFMGGRSGARWEYRHTDMVSNGSPDPDHRARKISGHEPRPA